MKEKLYTIPLNDAIHANDECPFCYIERVVEQDLMDFVLGSGSSYMESDIREETDRTGFCRTHFKKMYEYGNTLGNGWILKTHLMKTNKEMSSLFKSYTPGKTPLFAKKSKASDQKQNSVAAWIADREKSCYICNRFAYDYTRYLDTFFVMWEKDADFRKSVLEGKGFCLTHFGDLCEYGESKVKNKDKSAFYKEMFSLMERNMKRMEEDVTWLVDKFDYRNKDADWKNSKDAIQRGMQKMKGGYPGDSPYKSKK